MSVEHKLGEPTPERVLDLSTGSSISRRREFGDVGAPWIVIEQRESETDSLYVESPAYPPGGANTELAHSTKQTIHRPYNSRLAPPPRACRPEEHPWRECPTRHSVFRQGLGYHVLVPKGLSARPQRIPTKEVREHRAEIQIFGPTTGTSSARL